MRINLFHICPFGPGFNIGNFLIQQAVRRMFSRQFPDGINFITIPATGHGVRSGLTKYTVYQINQVADGVIVGGGNLFENGQLDVDVNALAALRKPMILFSTSYGGIYGEDGQIHRRTDAIPDNVLKALLEKSQIVLSRDIATKSHLDSIFSHHSHHVSGCPSIYISSLANRELAKRTASENYNLIAVRNPEQMNIPLGYQLRIHSITMDIIEVINSVAGGKLRILCNDQRDLEYAASLGSDLIYTSDVYEYFQILAHVNTAVSFRVHTSLPLWSLGCPALNLSYDQRSSSLIHTVDMCSHDINIMETNFTSLLDNIERRLTELTSVEDFAPSTWHQLMEIQDRSIRDFLQLIKEWK